MPQPKPDTASPFKKAKSIPKRLKLFVWGEAGAGKTTLALQFPSPVVLDLEGGTDLYGDDFDFDVMGVSTPDEMMKAVDWLAANEHDYKTVVIDPISLYWDALQYKWSAIFLKRNQKSTGFHFEFYDIQYKDWMIVKAEHKRFLRRLLALPMHIVVTAREAEQKGKDGFTTIGKKHAGEKDLPYNFDTVVRLHRGAKGEFLGTCIKDRANKLPASFEVSYGLFEGLFGFKDSKKEK